MDQINYTSLGDKIRKARREKHITQERLGEICSLSTSHIGHIERGTRIPSLETVFRIACELDVSIDYLLLDSFDRDDSVILALSAGLKSKSEEKRRAFFKTVKALADNIDEL